MIDVRDLAPVTPITGDITIAIDDAPPAVTPELGDATERRWAELLAENPRHFDGPILAIESFDPETNTIRARREGYKRLAVQPEVETGVRILSVTGLITALDERGRPCVLLARRSDATRIHGGLWELAPSGGIDPPGNVSSSFSLEDIRAQLASEMREELGLILEEAGAEPIALVADGPGLSVDIVLRMNTNAPITDLSPSIEQTWEYTALRWVPLGEASSLATRDTGELIPSTRDLLLAIS